MKHVKVLTKKEGPVKGALYLEDKIEIATNKLAGYKTPDS